MPHTDLDAAAQSLLEPWAVNTADELHQVLVRTQPAPSESNGREPVALLWKHHGDDPKGVVMTLALLLTDSRWATASGILVNRIEASGLVSEDGLDRLAESFVRAGRAVLWPMPDAEGGALVRRSVYLPLRRWGAARMVRRQPERWSEVFGWLATVADTVDLAAADVTLLGMVESADFLSAQDRGILVGRASAWDNASVRLLSLQTMVSHGGEAVARRCAATDSSPVIRAWAAPSESLHLQAV